jgi:D-aspartate ligase
METGFLPLLFGGDINVYSVARAFHEAYGVKSACYGKYPTVPAYTVPSLTTDVRRTRTPTLSRQRAEFAEARRQSKDLLVGCGDTM